MTTIPDLIARLRDRMHWFDSEVADTIEAQAARIERLEGALRNIMDGNYPGKPVRKVDTCKHDKFSWECCEQCIDEYIASVLNTEALAKENQHD